MTDRQTGHLESGTAEVSMGAVWRKSSYSGTQGNCVEVTTNLPGVVAVRDSKRPGASALVFSLAEWQSFVRCI
jgi:Domain of unknown function (DUF397)